MWIGLKLVKEIYRKSAKYNFEHWHDADLCSGERTIGHITKNNIRNVITNWWSSLKRQRTDIIKFHRAEGGLERKLGSINKSLSTT